MPSSAASYPRCASSALHAAHHAPAATVDAGTPAAINAAATRDPRVAMPAHERSPKESTGLATRILRPSAANARPTSSGAACSLTHVCPPAPSPSSTSRIVGSSSTSASASPSACAIFTGPHESKLRHIRSPAASVPAPERTTRTGNPSSRTNAASHATTPHTAPEYGIATRGPLPPVPSYEATSAPTSALASGASLSSLGKHSADSYRGHACPRAPPASPPTANTVRSMGLHRRARRLPAGELRSTTAASRIRARQAETPPSRAAP